MSCVSLKKKKKELLKSSLSYLKITLLSSIQGKVVLQAKAWKSIDSVKDMHWPEQPTR